MGQLTESGNVTRQRLRVAGVVQGVGFRPFVYRLAAELELGGHVVNDSAGVTIEIEGDQAALAAFHERLVNQAPTLARIDTCLAEEIEARGEREFKIQPSERGDRAATLIPPDVATCDDCLKEMLDPADRRYRYPFINCTNCGPRFTIVRTTPYDRAMTSMQPFAMCPECEAEYTDPLNRRFHAEPVACPACGPMVRAHDGTRELAVDDPIRWAVELLKQGKILAVRGLGGFHLAVDAFSEKAVDELRRRKGREEKPLALMAPDVETIRRYCVVEAAEAEALRSTQRPIVLLARREEPAGLARSVAYDNRYYGFMLPYTPLHHLLMRGNFDALVMTSGNRSDEPIAMGNNEALTRLGEIADGFLLHDREILQRCDDSIVRVAAGQERVIRRARGFVPEPVYLRRPIEPCILALGGELKNTIALSRGNQVFFSQHIGDLDNPAALRFFDHCIDHLQRVLEVEPTALACDMHPEYLSTKWARARADLPVAEVQHHHAHLAAVLAETGTEEKSIGIILDGTGYGPDETIWGGEVLIGDAVSFVRYAWLEPVPLPGGSAAIREPWRMALSYLRTVYGEDLSDEVLPRWDAVDTVKRDVVLQMIDKRLNTPMTSSCGRLFDGVAALLGLGSVNRYEAQAAMSLEMAATAVGTCVPGRTHVHDRPGRGAIPVGSLIESVVTGVKSGEAVERIAARFHAELAELFVAAANEARQETSIGRVALSGGVYQNRLFFEYMVRRLTEEGFTVLTHSRTPTNDGAVALGQVLVAAAAMRG